MSHPSTALSAEYDDCTILHIDMDAFYVCVELIDRPELTGLPVIVAGGAAGSGSAGGAAGSGSAGGAAGSGSAGGAAGGGGAGALAGTSRSGGNGAGRSVVLSASYAARRAGVRSAMPMARARRICPQAVVIEPDHQRYAEVSHGVMEIFRSVTPLVEPLGLDEAFLDVSAAVRRLGSARRIGQLIRDRVADEQRIHGSVGIAAGKFVAKLASARAKPDGLLMVPRNETVRFLHALPVGALWGVGERTEEALHRLGLLTVADIAHTPLATVRRAFGHAAGTQLHELAWGRDPRPVVPQQVEKSVGAEETFRTDVDDPQIIRNELLRLSDRVAARVRSAGMLARTVVIKIRFADFSTITRSRTLAEHTDVSRVVHATTLDLYARLGLDRARLRLVGVRLEGLIEVSAGHHQLVLGERAQGWREAERAVDRAGARFGAGAVRPASLVADPAHSPAGRVGGVRGAADSGGRRRPV